MEAIDFGKSQSNPSLSDNRFCLYLENLLDLSPNPKDLAGSSFPDGRSNGLPLHDHNNIQGVAKSLLAHACAHDFCINGNSYVDLPLEIQCKTQGTHTSCPIKDSLGAQSQLIFSYSQLVLFALHVLVCRGGV